MAYATLVPAFIISGIGMSHGGYASGALFVAGLSPAVWAGSAGVAADPASSSDGTGTDRSRATVATPQWASSQCCGHVVALQQAVQQADGNGITGACRVYLVGGNGIDVYFAGGSNRHPHPLPASRYHPPIELLA